MGICGILQSPPLPLVLPSLAFSLVALSFLFSLGRCVHACRPEGLQYKGGNCKLQLPPLLNNLSLCAFSCSA